MEVLGFFFQISLQVCKSQSKYGTLNKIFIVKGLNPGFLTLKMTTAQVVEMSVTVNNNNPIQD